MTTFKFIMALVVILLIADFGVRNNLGVPINYHFGLQGNVPLFVVILVAVFIGVVIAWIAEHLSSFKIKGEAKRLRRRNAELEAELVSYKEKELLGSEIEKGNETPINPPKESEENQFG